MRRFFLICIFAYSFIGLFVYSKAEALAFPAGHHSVTVGASIGQFTLNLTGFIAPYASVVLTSNGTVLQSTAANAQGYFSFDSVLIKQGFSQFCLDSVDVKRLGQSEACFSVPPATGSITKNNIFLPPTIGLYRTQIQIGSNAIIWGYSMPGAVVTVHASDGKDYTATADATGFYQISTLITQAGNYDFTATAVLKKQNSEKPTNKVTLVALTFAQSTNQKVGNWLRNLLTFLFNIPLGPLWLAIPIIILIYILWRKLQGKPLIPQFEKDKLPFDFFTKKRKLHHHYLHGVGY